MSKDKIGVISLSKYFPSSPIGHAKAYFHLPYRQTEGISLGHAKGKVPSIPHYTTINRRINKSDIKIKDNDSKNKEFKDEYIVIVIDSIVLRLPIGQWAL